ncbi:MAG: DNA-3-methyladenine glycosylase [Acidobacteriota bacterium]
MTKKVLPRSFYTRDTHIVCRELLGKVLIRKIDNHIVSGRIVEVEAYVGFDDLASHASKGRTSRTDVMFGPAGHAYVYLVYGMHHCLNIVTEKETYPAAVLIRALEPIEGVKIMTNNRTLSFFQSLPSTHHKLLTNLTSGPGKLCQALAVDKSFSGKDITRHDSELFIVDDDVRISTSSITTTPRIGVAYAGASATLPWRYFITNSPFVSR